MSFVVSKSQYDRKNMSRGWETAGDPILFLVQDGFGLF